MSDVHIFKHTFLQNGAPVAVDNCLFAEILDPLGRKAGEPSLASGAVEFNAATAEYSFSADLAPLCEGGVTVRWYAKIGGVPAEPYPFVELRKRRASHMPRFGAAPEDVLTLLRGLDYADFSPLFSNAGFDGETVINGFLDSAAAHLIAALPPRLFDLLTRRAEIVCESAPGNIRHFELTDIGGTIISCGVFIDSSDKPLAPDAYSLAGNTLELAETPDKGTLIVAKLTYSGIAPDLFARLTASLAATSAALSLVPAGNPARGILLAERRGALSLLGLLRSGNLLPAEWRTIPLVSGAPPAPNTLCVGRLKLITNEKGQ